MFWSFCFVFVPSLFWQFIGSGFCEINQRMDSCAGTVVWAPPGVAASAHATELIVQDDCNLVLKEHSTVLWATGTNCKGSSHGQEQQPPTGGASASGASTTTSPAASHGVHTHRAEEVVAGGAGGGRPLFYVLRNILKSATYMADVADATTALIPNMTFVDPYTLGTQSLFEEELPRRQVFSREILPRLSLLVCPDGL
jgi:hypothetical protein